MALKTRDVDRGAKRIMSQVEKLKRHPYVKIGVLETAGGHRRSPGIDVASLASVHEFGSTDGRIPERSFIRSTIDENESRLLAMTKRLKDEILLGGTTVRAALGSLGLVIQGLIQKKIADGSSDWPDLAEETIRRKGSSAPLIDTGQLRQSIRYQVVEGGGD